MKTVKKVKKIEKVLTQVFEQVFSMFNIHFLVGRNK